MNVTVKKRRREGMEGVNAGCDFLKARSPHGQIQASEILNPVPTLLKDPSGSPLYWASLHLQRPPRTRSPPIPLTSSAPSQSVLEPTEPVPGPGRALALTPHLPGRPFPQPFPHLPGFSLNLTPLGPFPDHPWMKALALLLCVTAS